MSSKIKFHYVQVSGKLMGKRAFVTHLSNIFCLENKSVESVEIIFCSDAFLLELNRKFLRHDFFTDTMTFAYQKRGDPIIGEVYVSLERVAENSKNLKIRYQEELKRVIIHGILHLCGYLDKKSQKRLMERTQEKYLKQYVSRETKHK